MKKITLLLFTLLVFAHVHAQNLLQFTATLNGSTEVPPNASPYVGNVLFWLDGTTLNFAVGVYLPMPTPTGATINGPAATNEIGSVIFDLGAGFPVVPDSFNNGQNWGWGGGILNLTREQISQVTAGKWYVTILTTNFPNGELRGQIIPQFNDSDHDGVPDGEDQCQNTPPGTVVGVHGCSIAQLCPCGAPWRHHAEYVRCVRTVSAGFVKQSLITKAEMRAILKEATDSGCGRR